MAERYNKAELEGLSIDAQILADEIERIGDTPGYFLTPRHAQIFGKHIAAERRRGLKSDFMLGNTLVRVKRKVKPDNPGKPDNERHRP